MLEYGNNNHRLTLPSIESVLYLSEDSKKGQQTSMGGNMAFRNHKGTINKLDVGLRRSIYDAGVPSVCYEYRWLIKNLFGPIVAKNRVRWEFKATRE